MKLPFGLRDGQLRHVAEVERGLACQCVCPCCGVRLKAKKGAQVQHHFAHDAVVECEGALQTALHLKAKEILARRREIVVPPVTVQLQRRDGAMRQTLWRPKRVTLDEVHVEIAESGFVPDLTATASGRRIFIEVRVTHKVDVEKLERMKRTGAAVLEINLSHYERAFNADELEAVLIGDSGLKVWLFNPKAAAFEESLAKRAIPRTISRIPRARLRVPNCPLTRGSADYLNDCTACNYLWDIEGITEDGSFPAVVRCLGASKSYLDDIMRKTSAFRPRTTS